MTSTATELPLLLGTVEVRAVTRLSPSFVRIELGGPLLADLGVERPWFDQRIKLVLPGTPGVVPSFEGAAAVRHLGDGPAAPVVTDGDVDPDLWETPTYSSSGEEVSLAEAEVGPHADLYAWIAGEAGVVRTCAATWCAGSASTAARSPSWATGAGASR